MEKQRTTDYYSLAWMDFMEENHPDLVAQMKQEGIYEEVAWSVSCRAVEYCDLLKRQYAKQNPPPKDPDEYRSWKFTRDYYIDIDIPNKACQKIKNVI